MTVLFNIATYYSDVTIFLYLLCSSSGVFLVCGECAETHFVPALLAQFEHCLVKELSIATLHSAHYNSPQQAVISVSNISFLFIYLDTLRYFFH